MRKITHIVLHCTATPQTTTVKSIQNYWKNSLGWKSPGYHHIIKADGEIVDLQPIDKPSNGVAGHNMNSIHISYIGGVDAKGKAIDNRTQAQICSQITLLKKYKAMFPDAQIVGHRDFPGVSKSCPSFDVKTWLKTAGI
jgi:N-acetylmuramoyl-L-alanine amidase